MTWNNGAGTEECDDGDADNSDSCSDSCLNAVCGDGYVWSTDGGLEECDDANTDNQDDCLNSCMDA